MVDVTRVGPTCFCGLRGGC